MDYIFSGFPDGSAVKNLPANAGDTGSIPGEGRSPGEGNVNPCHRVGKSCLEKIFSCLENLMDRGYGPWGCKDLDTA